MSTPDVAAIAQPARSAVVQLATGEGGSTENTARLDLTSGEARTLAAQLLCCADMIDLGR